MKARRTTIAAVTVAAALSTLTGLGTGTALARTTGPAGHAADTLDVTRLISYVTRIQELSADGTSSWGVACPAGTLPVGGGAVVQDPRLESVTQAGFHASAATGRFDGYQASVQVSGLRPGGKARFAVQAACMPATTRLAYLTHTQ